MRTRTNISYGAGIRDGIRLLSNFYSAGNVNVVYDEREKAEKMCEELTDFGYRADLRPFERPDFPNKGFTIGLGGERVAPSVKRCAPLSFAFFPTEAVPELLTCADGRFAEFAYFDTLRFDADDPEAAAMCHCALFTAFTEGLAVSYADMGRPYKDKGLAAVLTRAKELLNGGADREEYIRETLRTTGLLTDCLHARGVDSFTASEMAISLGGGLENRYSAAYFLNRLLILFTKWNFRDMLISAERPRREASCDVRPCYGEADLILGGAELSRITDKVRAFTARPDLKRLVCALKKAAGAGSALFAEIYNRGIPEGLIDYG